MGNPLSSTLAAPIVASIISPAPLPITNSPQQMSITREHGLKMAEKAMDDVSSLIKFLASNDPQLLSISNLTTAHHLISRFVASLQKSKHTSGGVGALDGGAANVLPSSPAVPGAMLAPSSSGVMMSAHTAMPAVTYHPANMLPSMPLSTLQAATTAAATPPPLGLADGMGAPAAAAAAGGGGLFGGQQHAGAVVPAVSAAVLASRESEPLPPSCALNDFTMMDTLGMLFIHSHKHLFFPLYPKLFHFPAA